MTLEDVTIIDPEIGRIPQIEQGARRGEILAKATNLCRDLTNAPSNQMTPTRLAEAARTWQIAVA